MGNLGQSRTPVIEPHLVTKLALPVGTEVLDLPLQRGNQAKASNWSKYQRRCSVW